MEKRAFGTFLVINSSETINGLHTASHAPDDDNLDFDINANDWEFEASEPSVLNSLTVSLFTFTLLEK